MPRTQRTSRVSTSTQLIKRISARDAQHYRIKKQAISRRMKKHRIQSRIDDSISSTIPPRILNAAARKAIRERWAAIAEETQRIVLGDGQYVEERCVAVVSPAFAQSHGQGIYPTDDQKELSTVRLAHNIFPQIVISRQNTTFYPHYSDSLANWVIAPRRRTSPVGCTAVEFARSSTLTTARRLSQCSPSSMSNPIVGILSHASPKRPGGGFLHGGDEQEETIARLSSLVASLSAPAAKEFYKEHKKHWSEDGSGLHDHSMVYSPGVVVFRSDGGDSKSDAEDNVGGDFIAPYCINVVSAVPVNAAAVRSKHLILPSEVQFFEDGIRSAMKERMGRALRVFEEAGNRVLVLGAFGCGSSQNNVGTIASIWAELLVCGDAEGEGGTARPARFKSAFDKVVFAVPGKLFAPFKRAFEMRVFEGEVMAAAMS